ncbi:hypothetical protein GUJ93_ZPchr0010g10869 [Zizania palustris]|uniref:Uncharacterized protein n=1 Tax=Zizania palustris TaxID=103762 RepID=A0A8J5WH40_ZIZPA|nr:hypothetical protein GUJ93_ZPchr0010g10869 [Zizania palustris]
MLTLAQYNSSSPRSSPGVKDCIDVSPEEANISGIQEAGMKEFAKERNQYDEDSGNACPTSEVLDDKADQYDSTLPQPSTLDKATSCLEDMPKVQSTPDLVRSACSEEAAPLAMSHTPTETTMQGIHATGGRINQHEHGGAGAGNHGHRAGLLADAATASIAITSLGSRRRVEGG